RVDLFLLCLCLFFFFFSSRRRHTRFSRDWSSDVCSSDLSTVIIADILRIFQEFIVLYHFFKLFTSFEKIINSVYFSPPFFPGGRSEERRVGKECRSRWSRYNLKEVERTESDVVRAEDLVS